jgi:hypothetical protein
VIKICNDFVSSNREGCHCKKKDEMEKHVVHEALLLPWGDFAILQAKRVQGLCSDLRAGRISPLGGFGRASRGCCATFCTL